MSSTNMHDEVQGKWRRFSRSRLFNVIMIAVAILVVVALVFAVVRSRQNNKELSAFQKAQQQAARDSSVGKYDQAYKQLKAIESQAKTKDEKVQIYGDLASAAANIGQMGQALQYLEKKHAADPSTAGADGYLVGSYYERTGDISKALANYQVALEYLEKQNPKDDVTIQSLKARIQSLKGQ